MWDEQPLGFQCPNCFEFINTSMEKCSFCAFPVNREMALTAASVQEKVNRAYSEASYMRIVAGAMWLFFLLSFIPFISFVTFWAYWFTFAAVPVFAIIWQVRFGNIESPDPDYQKAVRTKNISLLMWVPLGLLFVIRLNLVWFMSL
jgi:hypothetical protein